MEEKRGTIAGIHFYNEGNGYSVILFETEEEQFTAVGALPVCHLGTSLILRGDFTVHPVYGEQFNFREFEEVRPKGADEIRMFLASGVIRGIREKTAELIVEKFGDKTLDIFDNEPERLLEVTGIGEKRLKEITESYSEHRKFADVVIKLSGYDIGADYATKLYKVYGSDVISILEENPYRLIDEVYGIGFKKADAIAVRMGFDPENENRIKSGLRFMLGRYISDGNTYVPENLLCEETGALLDVSTELVSEALFDLAIEGDIRIENSEGRNNVYLFEFYRAEQNVCHCLERLSDADVKSIRADAESLADMVENETGLKLSAEQRYAVLSSVSEGVSVITGGPGTGKTTIIKVIISILERSGLNVAIAAPTGRAAKRITETSGHDASTIHRLLEYCRADDEFFCFARNSERPLEYDAVIIDEASMIDLLLMDALVSAIRPGTRFILVGDKDQLPSVGAGNVLSDIIESERVHSVCLTEIFRQAGESLIVVNAHRINKGEYPEYDNRRDFFFMKRNDEQSVLATIEELCKKRLPKYYSRLNAVRDIQVLTPTKKGTAGAVNLNSRLQNAFNPAQPGLNEKVYGERTFRENDKVMQIKNNYELTWRNFNEKTEGEGVFNGDIGFIESINKDSEQMTVIFDECRYVTYDFSQLDELELAYAVTVHKSQGSEFPIVVMPMTWIPPLLATRNLLYTAITRGKTAVVLVGSEQRMNAMIDNNRIAERYSGLDVKMRENLQKTDK